MLLTANRRFLRSAWFWCGMALALLLFAPNLWWQYQHHFVSLEWMRSIHARDIGMGRTGHFLLNQLWKTCAVVALPLLFAGLWFLFARPEGRRWRMIGWMYVLTLAGLMAARGRDYYLAPAYPMLLAASAVWGEQWLGSLPAQKQKRILGARWRTLGIGGLCVAALTPTCMPTRLRIATDSHPALAPLCLDSAPHTSRQPSSQPVNCAGAARTVTATAH
jgi:hypothetical protein